MEPVWAWPKTASASPWPWDGDGKFGMAWGYPGRMGMGWLRPYRFFNLDVFEYASFLEALRNFEQIWRKAEGAELHLTLGI